MIEIIEQPESIDLSEIGIRFVLGDVGGHFDGNLLVTQSYF
jgi:hypothetical protein